MADFSLTDDDRIALAAMIPQETRLRRKGWFVTVVPVLGAVAMLVIGMYTGATVFASVVPLLMVVALLPVTVPVFFRGSGAVDRVLAGGAPSATTTGSVVGNTGSAPWPWTLALDAPVSGARYFYLRNDVADWLGTPGIRYTAYIFGGRFMLRGVALFVCDEDGRRHWVFQPKGGRTPGHPMSGN